MGGKIHLNRSTHRLLLEDVVMGRNPKNMVERTKVERTKVVRTGYGARSAAG